MTPVTKAYIPNKHQQNHQAWRNGWLSNEQVAQTAQALSKNGYGKYLADLIK
ncbi:hypothetical protein [Thiomicrospira sp. ALE5]|uniref:hypothetical protein n=1 Tax=Thiomicrospira sp. ALE5 TaxID=748650 RepID=UPI000AA5379A|nr:hypothetical protein [Thiomicrospira sp. ALE5]